MERTQRIAEFVAAADYARIPPAALQRAREAILDSVGVALAGSREEASRIAAATAREEGSSPRASVIGHGFRASPMLASLVNGVSAHALDFDASFTIMGQPMSGLAPTVLALSESAGASGRQLLQAYVAGFELTAKLAWSMPAHAETGAWHGAGTLGTFGCTAAACNLLGLDAGKTVMALGIAGSMACGVVRNYGTMTKPLHAGLAARNGVLAARLAQQGHTASAAILQAPGGIYDSFARGMTLDPAVFDALGRDFELEAGGVSIKPYPCGGLTHPAVDAVLGLRKEHGLAAKAIERIDVGITPFTGKRIAYRIPQTGLQGKFSMAYVLARTVIDGQLTLDTFTDAAVRDPGVLALAEKVHTALDPELAGYDRGIYPCKVSIHLADGRALFRRVDHPKGTPESPLTADELRQKFLDCAGRVLEPAAAIETLDRLEQLHAQETLHPLGRLLSGT